ncbi:MAG: aldehyde dehydrogenase family protein [Myxococcales bacterium]|nr:aldehyde dehydrogenase family protein [Myxococcales bacterium]MCB9707169.1 aldehyde dehydrogenase family protein [Myxococcales bacterium]
MPLATQYPLFVGNQAQTTGAWLPVFDKYSGKEVSRVALADKVLVDKSIELAEGARTDMAEMPAFARKNVLLHCVRRVQARAAELADALCIEAGKPIRDARTEVQRLIDTFTVAAEEAVRSYGEVLPLDTTERTVGYWGAWKRVPIGVCSFITPFNFPLNLVAHKIAPAIAAGCPFVLKPSSLTPVGALIVAEILAECELPRGAFSILPCHSSDAEALITDARIKLLSFTGSDVVGWDLKNKAGKKRVILELGGNAAVIIDKDTDLDDAVSRLVTGAFYQSGQSCISVQRMYVHAEIYDRFRDLMVARTRALPVGDPADESTVIGPIISEKEATRVENWVKQSIDGGARLLCGGGRQGRMMQPTLLEQVSAQDVLYRKEVFGPVAFFALFDSFDDALNMVNDSDYGLQAGVFTRDFTHVQKAWHTLEVGGVIINDVPSWRVDHMPYGGVKDSGLGREGVRFSMDEMTEIRLLAVRTLPEPA